MSHLLQVLSFNSAAVKQGKVPLLMEFGVSPESAPYLVSASTGFMWISTPHPGDIVKAAVQHKVTPAKLFMEILDSVGNMGRQAEWGNIHPFNEEGLEAAIQHVQHYELGDLEILVPRVRGEDNDDGEHERPAWLGTEKHGLPIRPTGWLPDDCAVVLPQDRSFVGFLGRLKPRVCVAVVHNASRSIGLIRGTP